MDVCFGDLFRVLHVRMTKALEEGVRSDTVEVGGAWSRGRL